MKNVSTFEIIGRVSKVQIESAYVRITTCSNYNYKDAQSGEWKQDPHWNQTTAFAERAREAAAKLEKGDLVKITGRMKQSSYMKNGERVFTTDFVAWSVEFVSKPNSNAAREDMRGDVKEAA